MTNQTHCSETKLEQRPCPLGRRLMAMLYDGFLLVGIWMIAAVAVVVPTNHGVDPQTTWFQVYLAAITWLYFAVSWRKGCTLGMKAWHIRIQSGSGDRQSIGSIGWGATLIRFVVALASLGSLGLGYFWSLFRKDKAAWHDLASNTFLVVIPKSASGQKRKRQGTDQ